MGKCFNTRLDGSVNNHNLPILGVVKFKMNSGTWFMAMSANNDSDCIVSGDNGISFSSYGGNPYTNPFQLTSSMAGFNVTASANGNEISIADKYNIKTITDGTFSAIGIKGVSEIEGGYGELYFPSNMDSVAIENCSFSYSLEQLLEPMADLNLRRISLKNNSAITGEISDFASFAALESITINYCANLTGDIADLNSSVITNMALANSNIGGTIEGFVAKQRSLGRATGSVGGNSAGWGKVTFNGSTANAKGTVSWTATTITMNGVTITA